MGVIVSWVAIAVGLWVATLVVRGFKISGGWGSYALVALLFAVLNFFLGFLLNVVIAIASLGLAFLPLVRFVTQLVVGAVVLKAADKLSTRLRIDSFVDAFLAALILSLVQTAVHLVFK